MKDREPGREVMDVHKAKRPRETVAAVVVLVVCVGLVCALAASAPKTVRTDGYLFLCPRGIAVETTGSTAFPEITLRQDGKTIGGVVYEPSLGEDDLYTPMADNDPTFDLEALLTEKGCLAPGETLDAYMMEASIKTKVVEMRETRDGVERYHVFFFPKAGGSYDLWSFWDQVDAATAKKVKDSFQLLGDTGA